MNPSIAPGVPTTQSYIPQAPTADPYTPYNAAGNSAIANAQSALQTPQSQPTQVPQQKGNWFTHLLPTIGSIAAPVIGGLLAPETGGLSLLASLALAGGGSAAGKAAEEGIQGQKIDPTQLLESAGEGAGGQLIGGGIGKLAGGVVGKATDALSGAVEGRAAQAATDTAAQSAADEASRIGHEFGAVKPGQAQVGPALDILRGHGIENPTAQDMINVGRTYTGSNPETGTGILNFYKQQALDQAGGQVNTGNVMMNLESNLAKPENSSALGSIEPVSSSRGQLPKVPTNDASKIIQQVRNMLPSGATENGAISTSITPQEGVSLLKNVGNQISATTPKPNALGVLDQSQVAQNNIWKSVYGDVRDAVYNRPEVDSAVSGLKVGPEEESVIDDAIKSNGINDPQVATSVKSDLINTLNNAQSGNDLLTAERPMVNVAKVGDIAQSDMANNPQLPRNVSGNKAAAAPTPPPDDGNGGLLSAAALATAPMTHGTSLLGLLPKAAQVAKSPEAQEIANKLINSGVTKKVASAIPAVLTGASQFLTHAPDDQANPVNLNLGSNSMQPQSTNDPNSLNSLLLQLAIAESANPTTSSAGAAGLQQIVPQIQNSNIAQNSLTGAENAFQQAGGGQGGVLGSLSKILGTITGNPASQYEQQRQQLMQQLTPLGIPTSAVPDITGNNQSAQNQFQTLQQMINARLNGSSPSAIPTQ